MHSSQLTAFLYQAMSKPEAAFTHQRNLVEPASYFSKNRLEELLSNPLLGPNWLQVSVKGKPLVIDEDNLWKVVQGKKLFFLDKKRITEAIAQGASIVLEGVDILDTHINSVCAEIDAQLPCALANCEAFYSQLGNEAYFGHRDSDDVLVIQIGGRKKWRIYQPQQRSYRGNSPLTEVQMGPLLAEVLMEPGDVLFVRAGVPHRCITPSSESLHLSFDLCDRTPNIEQITHAANQIYAESLAPMHTPATEVVLRYIDGLKSESFSRHLDTATREIREQIVQFRGRIFGSHDVSSLRKVKDIRQG